MKCTNLSVLLLLLAITDLAFGRGSPKRESRESQVDLNNFVERGSEKCGIAICRRREDLFIPKPEDPIPVAIPEGGGDGIGDGIGEGGGVDPPLGEGGGDEEGGGGEEGGYIGEGGSGEEEGGDGEEGDENPELPDLPSPDQPSSTDDDPSQPITPATATNLVAASQSSGIVSSDAPIFCTNGKLILWSTLTLSIFNI